MVYYFFYFFTLFSNDFVQITVIKYLFYFLALIDLSPSMTFDLTDRQIFFISPFIHPNPTIKKSKVKK
jgi:hypothetical protein